MKKMIALCLAVVCLLSLVACSTNDTDNTKPQAGQNNTTANPNDNTTANPNDNTTANPNDSTTAPPADNDATIKAELIAKVGMPFRLWRTEGMSLWCFTISENSAERDYSNSMEGQFIAKSLSWKIENGELVITGEWNETFTLDLNAMKATSKTDGAVYSIVE
jgi:hypothetical protein